VKNFIGIFFFIPFLFFNDIVVTDTDSLLQLIIIIFLLGIFPSSLSYLFFNWGVKVIGINKSTIFTNAIPVVTAVLAFFWLNEEIIWQNIVGMVIVILSLTLTQILADEK